MTDLFTYKPAPADPYFETEVAKRAAEFDRQNPSIYGLFIKFTMEAYRAGRRKFGAQAIFERIRWHVQVETTGDEFKVNNSHIAYFARKAMAEHPQLAGFFETRSASE